MCGDCSWQQFGSLQTFNDTSSAWGWSKIDRAARHNKGNAVLLLRGNHTNGTIVMRDVKYNNPGSIRNSPWACDALHIEIVGPNSKQHRSGKQGTGRPPTYFAIFQKHLTKCGIKVGRRCLQTCRGWSARNRSRSWFRSQRRFRANIKMVKCVWRNRTFYYSDFCSIHCRSFSCFNHRSNRTKDDNAAVLDAF